MQNSQLPVKFVIPFASSAGAGFIRAIPVASQIGITNGAASLTDGFPPVTFQPVGAGGTPPFGQDFNGLGNQITAWNRWQAAGGAVQYDQTFANAIGGYPEWAIVASKITAALYWVNIVEGNTTDPEGASPSGWLRWGPAILQSTATINFFVDGAIGNDSNDGLSDTAGHAFATPQGAINAITSRYLALGTANVNIVAGTYSGYTVPVSGVANWNITGNSGSPSLVVVNATSNSVNSGRAIIDSSASGVTISGMTFHSVNENVIAGSFTTVQNCNATGPTGGGLPAFGIYGGSHMVIVGTINYSGNGAAFMGTDTGGTIQFGVVDPAGNVPVTVNLSGTPSFSSAFAFAVSGAAIQVGTAVVTFNGSASGARFSCTLNGVINTFGAGASFFPGNVAGSTATGGQYA